MKPVRGRELVVKMITGSYDFSVYFSHLGVHISGLVPNPHGQELHVNHSWRFVRRGEIWIAITCGID